MHPELKVEELKKQSDFLMGQIAQSVEEAKKKGPQELTTEDLDSIAGRKSFTGGRNAAFFISQSLPQTPQHIKWTR
ncbi:MAG: hypothetical protein IJT42_10810 [Treponema sp.]|nr:hypothetical protein [Treponema sp.]